MITMIRTGSDQDNKTHQVIESQRLRVGLITPAKEDTSSELAEDRTAEPIKNPADIDKVCRYLIDSCRWRDYMLFIVGINFGLRVSDLRELRFCDLISDDLCFKETVPVFEKKTRNTRKRKKNRYITVNQAVIDAVTLYLEHVAGVSLSDYMFRSESPNGKDKNKPLTARNVDRILKRIASAVGLDMKMSTHTLRKTFCYHQMLISGNDPRKLLLLQKMMGHASVAQTLDYIGITEDEMVDAYKDLNLGLGTSKAVVETAIVEKDVV